MLSFGKKKDPNNLKTSPKPVPKKPQEPSVSKEDIKHLEDTKHRLFGFVSKKSSKIKELSANFDKSGNNKDPPAPPPKPIRLTHHHIQQSSTNNSPIPSVSSPDTPFDGQEFGFHPLKTFAFPGLNLPALKVRYFSLVGPKFVKNLIFFPVCQSLRTKYSSEKTSNGRI